MMFDTLQRFILTNGGVVKYVNDQIGVPLDREVKVGKPWTANWLKEHTTIYHSLVGTALREDTEYIEYIQSIHSAEAKYGFMPTER